MDVIVAHMLDDSWRVLEKDCDCRDSIHTGPHWLHQDRLDRSWAAKRLKEIDESYGVAIVKMDGSGTIPSLSAEWLRSTLLQIAAHELHRLEAKRLEMERAGIAEILRGRDAANAKALYIDGAPRAMRR